MANPRLQRPLEDYIAYWEKLSSRSIPLLEKLADPSFRFSGPFHQVQGIEAAQNTIAALLPDAARAKIRVTDHSWGRDGQTAYLRWTLVFFPGGDAAQWTIQGMSEIMFTTDGKVWSHIDHWDSGSQILSRLKFAGWLFRKARDRIAS